MEETDDQWQRSIFAMLLKSFRFFLALASGLTAVYGVYGPQLPEGCQPFEGGYECTSVTDGT
ncbi:hypothetical protein K7432_002269 [Basidiobolus ranarum]|uniref:Uncharacterized protein n=1 Tax=Basidiobolus ranarum TaxID=34480 RepID=A0ABR2X1Q3_9FUNG